MFRLVALTLACFTLIAVEPSPAVDVGQPVDVPDPIGLGERLALIDWLQERRIAVANRDDLPALRLAYLKAARPELFADPDAGRKEAVALELWQRHGVNADRKEPLAGLEAMLAELDRRKGEAEAAERQRQLALSGGGPRSPAPVTPSPPPAPPRAPAGSAPARMPTAPPAQPPVAAAPAAVEEAPWAEFRELVWLVEGPSVRYWKTGDGSDLYPTGIGRIERKGLIGPQLIVWQNASHEITACRKLGVNLWEVGFARGTLRLTNHGERRWECEFTPTNSRIPRTFRTGGAW